MYSKICNFYFKYIILLLYHQLQKRTPLGNTIYEKKLKKQDGSTNIVDGNHGMQRVRNGLFAIHVEEAIAYEEVSRTYQEYEKCTLQSLRYMPMVPPYVAITKNSSYYEVIKVGCVLCLISCTN